MKVLSIDVGIKNLACCIFSIEGGVTNILKWDVLNIMTEPNEPEIIRHQCNYIIKRTKKCAGCQCNKTALYTTNDGSIFRCTQHAKKEPGYILPTAELAPKAVSKNNMTQLCELADKYQIAYTKPIKKAALCALIGAYSNSTCFTVIGSGGTTPTRSSDTNAQKICMIKLGQHLKQHLDMFIGGEFIDHVAIEKQMTARMKCIQAMIAQYFIMSSPGTKIAFVSATHKLEEGDIATATATATIDTYIDDGSSDSDDDMADICVEDIIRKMKQRTYNTRKTTGITYCIADLQKVNDSMYHIDFLKSHKKQDDLADCYLQGRWYIRKICNLA